MTEQGQAERPQTTAEQETTGSASGANGGSPGDQSPASGVTFARRMPSLHTIASWLARLIGQATVAICAVIALGIAFEVLGANDDKWIVATVEDIGKFLASPFDRMFTPESDDLTVAINWGIAIVVYAIIGRLLAQLVTRTAARAR